MSIDISAVVRQHEAFYEVRPHSVLVRVEDQTGAPVMRNIQAGFDIDIYGVRFRRTVVPSPDYWAVYEHVQEVVRSVLPLTTDCCTIQVIPFASIAVISTRRNMQWLGLLRIRIAHARGLGQPAGAPETQALKELDSRLRAIGLNSQGGGA